MLEMCYIISPSCYEISYNLLQHYNILSWGHKQTYTVSLVKRYENKERKKEVPKPIFLAADFVDNLSTCNSDNVK